MPTKRIFFDANIIIDLVSADSELNKVITLIASRAIERNEVLLCSPVSFAITYYFLSKRIKNNALLNNKTKEVFSLFSFTQENETTMDKAMQSSFNDLEDALQYYSALEAKADLIITENYFDFSKSTIPVYHPLHYLSEFIL